MAPFASRDPNALGGGAAVLRHNARSKEKMFGELSVEEAGELIAAEMRSLGLFVGGGPCEVSKTFFSWVSRFFLSL